MSRTLQSVVDEHFESEWGFTGTRKGMTHQQGQYVRIAVRFGKPAVIRHGGAHGADMEFHAMWREELPRHFADVWPAEQSRVKLFDGQDNVSINPVMAPLARDDEIVKRSKFLIAAPHTQKEEVRSGTWATIRRGRKIDIPILIVWPNGQMTLDHHRTLVRITGT